jgi:hypothetical protein
MRRLSLSVLIFLACAPARAADNKNHTANKPSSNPGISKEELPHFLKGRYRIANQMKLLSLSGTEISVQRGAIMDVVENTSSCANEDDPDAEETGRDYREVCPSWGNLVRMSKDDDEAVDGHCFCTSRANILAQQKIAFEEDGVTVITITKPGNPPPADTTKPPPAPYLEKLYATLKDNACHKDKFVTDAKAKARIAKCAARGKSLCNCSILRCSQVTKKSLVDAGLVASVDDLPGNANDPRIKTGLEKNGFIKCSSISEAEEAPNGAVIIYHAHNSSLKGDAGAPYGHIEVKTPSGYISDFSTPNARTTYGKMTTVKRGEKRVKVFNRYVAAIYVKPPVSCKD